MTLEQLLEHIKFLMSEAQKQRESSRDLVERCAWGGNVSALRTVTEIIENEIKNKP
jgi:hypothetical protein